MSDDAQTPPAPAAQISAPALEHGRNFLASMFMAARTAQIHDPSNQAFEQAIEAVSKSAQALFQATGGFSLRFVDNTVFLNGVRLRFEGGTYSTTQKLAELLGERGLGGLELHKTPSPAAIRKLVMLFAPHSQDADTSAPELGLGDIQMLGIQVFQDQRNDVRIDRKAMVVQSYGKLVLALRERLERIELRRQPQATSLGPPRLKPVRVLQDLVEMCEDRTDFVLRLAANRRGATHRELLGVNTSLLSLVMGHAVGLPRQELVDIGAAALLVPLGFEPALIGAAVGPETLDEHHAHAAAIRLLADAGISQSTYIRCIIVGEQSGLMPLDIGSAPHPYARMVRSACAYEQLVLGLHESGRRLHPLQALARLHNDAQADIDRRWIDLLINVLRAFPKGAQVVLDDGTQAEVLSQMGGTRWDRPMVRTPDGQTHDLMIQEEGRFLHRIKGTTFYCGLTSEPSQHLEEEAPASDALYGYAQSEALPPPTFEPLIPDQGEFMNHEDDPVADDPMDRTDAMDREQLAALMQSPLLDTQELDAERSNDTDVAAFAPPEFPAGVHPPSLDEPGDDDEDFASDDPLDVTQADPFDPSKTQESIVPIPWDD
ncbi:MAG: hypothetical protein AAFN74_01110 [Myxococcota bacterium]